MSYEDETDEVASEPTSDELVGGAATDESGDESMAEAAEQDA